MMYPILSPRALSTKTFRRLASRACDPFRGQGSTKYVANENALGVTKVQDREMRLSKLSKSSK